MYAKRCMVEMGYKEVKVLARGPAIKRGVKIVTELDRCLKMLPEDQKIKIGGNTYLNFEQGCKFGFINPLKNPNQTQEEYLTPASPFFYDCGTSLQMKLEKLMSYKEPQTNHGLKPCIQINF